MNLRNIVLLYIYLNEGCSKLEIMSNFFDKYSSIKTANSAISRELKMLKSLNCIVESKIGIFITEKGRKMLEKDLESLLILEAVNSYRKVLQKGHSIDSLIDFVKVMSTLLEKAKENEKLFFAFNVLSRFSLADLTKIIENLEKRIKALKFMKNAFESKIESLEQLSFKKELKIRKSAKDLKRVFSECSFIYVKTDNKEIFDEIKEFSLIKNDKKKECLVAKENIEKVLDKLAKMKKGKAIIKFASKEVFIDSDKIIAVG